MLLQSIPIRQAGWSSQNAIPIMLFSCFNHFYGHNQLCRLNSCLFLWFHLQALCLSTMTIFPSSTGTLHKISSLHELPSHLSLNHYPPYLFNCFYLSFRTQLTVYCLGEVSLTSSHGPSNLLCWILCFASTYNTFIDDCLTTRLWAPWERPGSMYILSIIVLSIPSSAPGIQRSFNMFGRMKKTINEIKWHYIKISIINPYSKLYNFNTGT